MPPTALESQVPSLKNVAPAKPTASAKEAGASEGLPRPFGRLTL
jgi:hypothetical protein